jgi:hypothetical protein
VAGFDGETYLRLTGEQRLREGGSIDAVPFSTVLVAAASALVAVDAITTADARAIIDDYDLAVTVRKDRHLISEQAPRPLAPTAPGIGQVRVVPCGRVIDQPWGQLTFLYVAFTDHATTLRVELRLDVPSQRFSSGHPIPAWARRLSVTDSRGTTATAELVRPGKSGGSDACGPAYRIPDASAL